MFGFDEGQGPEPVEEVMDIGLLEEGGQKGFGEEADLGAGFEGLAVSGAGDVGHQPLDEIFNDHLNARFFSQEDTLGVVDVRPTRVSPDLAETFERLRAPESVARDLGPYRRWLDRPVDRRLTLEMRPLELPLIVERLMQVDSVWFAPVEWAGTMPMMNWMSTSKNVEWVLHDPDTGRENLDIDWRFAVGDVVKIRLHNKRGSLHAMQHPIHLHGQRFLIVEQDGVKNDNLVWKDTALIPVGSTIDLLLDVSNPGAWMLHCHIAEHLEAGMKMVFRVGGRE